MTHFQVYLKQSGPDRWNACSFTKIEPMMLPGNPATFFNPFTFLLYWVAISHFFLLLPRTPSYPRFQLMTLLPFLQWKLLLIAQMNVHKLPESHLLNYLCLTSALTPLSMDLLSFSKASLFLWISDPSFLLPSQEHCSNVSLSTASTIFPFLMNHSHQHTNIT